MTRQELVPDADSDATRLARELYMEHRGAFDAVLRARNTGQKMIQQCFDRLLTTTICEQPELLRRDDYNTITSGPPGEYLRKISILILNLRRK